MTYPTKCPACAAPLRTLTERYIARVSSTVHVEHTPYGPKWRESEPFEIDNVYEDEECSGYFCPSCNEQITGPDAGTDIVFGILAASSKPADQA